MIRTNFRFVETSKPQARLRGRARSGSHACKAKRSTN